MEKNMILIGMNYIQLEFSFLMLFSKNYKNYFNLRKAMSCVCAVL